MTYETVELTRSGAVATVTLNRPEKLNAASDELVADMHAAFRELEADATVRVAILTGAGRAFCAGADLGRAVEESDSTTVDVQGWRDHLKLENEALFGIWRSRLPVIAAVHGYALGLGCDLAMTCDLTIATESALFGEPEVHFQTTSQFMILPWVVGMKRTKEILLTGDRFSAQEARDMGMVNRVVPDDQLILEAERLAARIAKLPPPAVRIVKEQLHGIYDIQGFKPAIDYSLEMATLLLLSESEEAKEFFRIAAADGLKAAFRWRDEVFNPGGRA